MTDSISFTLLFRRRERKDRKGAIRVHVSNMRKKLPAGERLVAKRCVGYALVRG
jgi:DNA-binding response OmpR family regulator